MRIATDAEELLRQLQYRVWYEAGSLPLTSHLATRSDRYRLRVTNALLGPVVSSLETARDSRGKSLNPILLPSLVSWFARKRYKVRILQLTDKGILVLSDLRGHVNLCKLQSSSPVEIVACLNNLDGDLKIVPHGEIHKTIQNAVLAENLEVIDLAHSACEFTPPDPRTAE